MSSYCPDVNVWIALTYRGHQHHLSANSWFATLDDETAYFCRLTGGADAHDRDRKSTRLNSSYLGISYAVFCLKKKNQERVTTSITASTFSDKLYNTRTWPNLPSGNESGEPSCISNNSTGRLRPDGAEYPTGIT